MDPRWRHPFTCTVAGPTGCDKTTFVARLLRNSSTMIDPSPERVTWYYGEWQSAYENLDISNLYLEEGLPTSFDASKRIIVVLDDLMTETDESVTNLFTKKATTVILPSYISCKICFQKTRESYHQFELTVHSVVQESAKCVAYDYVGQTDVSWSSQVCSGGVRRCDVHSLRIHFGRSESEHPQGSTLAHVHTTGRCCSVCIHAKSVNSHEHRVTPHSTIICADSRST